MSLCFKKRVTAIPTATYPSQHPTAIGLIRESLTKSFNGAEWIPANHEHSQEYLLDEIVIPRKLS